MPTVEEYSQFFDGIINTAQKLYNQKGHLDANDIQVLYKIAKFTSKSINDESAEKLTTIYKTYYQKMSVSAISSLEQFIITREINGYIYKVGGTWDLWYVGISRDAEIEDQLFIKHKVNKKLGHWIYRSASTETTAQAIFNYYKQYGTEGGIHGTGQTARKIYAFKMVSQAKSTTSSHKGHNEQINPNRKVHDMDPEHYKQCPTCYGSGEVTCSSCGGAGGRSESRVDYDWDNNIINRDEWVSCYSCNGGQTTCHTCNGSGTVHR